MIPQEVIPWLIHTCHAKMSAPKSYPKMVVTATLAGLVMVVRPEKTVTDQNAPKDYGITAKDVTLANNATKTLLLLLWPKPIHAGTSATKVGAIKDAFIVMFAKVMTAQKIVLKSKKNVRRSVRIAKIATWSSRLKTTHAGRSVEKECAIQNVLLAKAVLVLKVMTAQKNALKIAKKTVENALTVISSKEHSTILAGKLAKLDGVKRIVILTATTALMAVAQKILLVLKNVKMIVNHVLNATLTHLIP
jgi:hypothetical protein